MGVFCPHLFTPFSGPRGDWLIKALALHLRMFVFILCRMVPGVSEALEDHRACLPRTTEPDTAGRGYVPSLPLHAPEKASLSAGPGCTPAAMSSEPVLAVLPFPTMTLPLPNTGAGVHVWARALTGCSSEA